MPKSLIDRFAGREKEILAYHNLVGKLDHKTMDYLKVTCYPSFLKLREHCERVVGGNGAKPIETESRYTVLRRALVEACKAYSTFDAGVFDALERIASEAEAKVADIEQRSKARIEFLEEQLELRQRHNEKIGVQILLAANEV